MRIPFVLSRLMRFPNLDKDQTMGKKIERMFRTGRLSEEEIARDEEVRRKVQAEFPPASKSAARQGG